MSRSAVLCLVSALTLFLEMALIRLVSTEIRIFAYLNNLVLLSCFLGLGLGSLLSRRSFVFWLTPLALTVLLAGLVAPLTISLHGVPRHLVLDGPMLLSALPDFLIWSAPSQMHLVELALGLTSTALIFITLLLIFLPLGQLTGCVLEDMPNRVRAYSLNLLAGLAGIWIFHSLCSAWAPPWVWLVVAWLMAWPLGWRARYGRASLAVCGVAILALGISARPSTTVWSPYQKLDVRPAQAGWTNAYTVRVNNVGYMNLLDLSRRGLQALPIHVDPTQRAFSQYDLPYRFVSTPPEHVLIVGAGGGNDVAGALRAQARQVTAVEIDPGIYRIGQRLHPEAPYRDPRVRMIVSDARAVFKRTTARFDVVSFGLLDAHTQSSSYHNMRLDHYVYTQESIREAASLLRAGGVLTVIFDAQRPYIASRIGALLWRVFGSEPVAFSVWSDGWFGPGGAMFVASHDMEQVRHAIAKDAPLRDFLAQHQLAWQRPVTLTSDDWPYLYLERPTVPTLHLWLSGLLLLGLVVVWRGSPLIPQRIDWHFFWLGAAFLLLEFQNISKMSLLFGSTWAVNAVTISAILALLVCANWVAHRLCLAMVWWYIGLLGSLLAVVVVPLAVWNAFPEPLRTGGAVMALNLPLFFAGGVFMTSFQRTTDAGGAFGSNLLGAAVGGLLESVSFVSGLQALVFLAAALYGLSALCRRVSVGGTPG